MKFKNYIETESGIKDTSTSPGTAGQVLSSTVTGTSWIDQGEIVAAAATVVAIECKNTYTTPLTKGTPVYQTGTVGATDVIEIAPGNALVSTGAQPSIGLLQQDLAINEFGYVIITGELLNITTDPIDGLTPVTGQKIFVKSGGGLTLTKPTTELNSIQNMGLVGKVSGGNAGSITVSSIMRTNDVPNLPTGRIWIGDGNTIVSDTVYVDDPNSSLIVNGTTLQTTEALSVIGAGYFSDKVSIGTASSTVPGDNSYTLNLLDLNSAMAFGDNSQTSRNVIVGEYGTTDTDQLWLHGKNGTFFTHNNPPSIAGVIDSIGNFGLGTTSPDSNLEVAGSTGSNTVLHVRNDSTGSTRLKLSNATDTNVNGFQIINNAFNGSVNLINYKAATLALWTNGSQRLTILSNGEVGIGTTSPIYELDVVGDIRARGNGTGNIYSGTFGARLSNYYSFLTTNSEFRVGYANGGGYSVCRASAFTVSSDYRLKEKIVTLTDPLDRLRQLNVYKFNWIDKPNEKAVDGFIAHEVAEVIPEAVVGVKDEIGIDGKPEYQGIDQAKIVPLLTAALQEAIKKIENLEERINLIENK